MKRNWMIALAAMMAMAVFGACASYSHFNEGRRSGDFFTQRSEHGDRGVVITSFIGENSDVQIPSYIRRRPVRIIGEGAFAGNLDGRISEMFGTEFNEEVRNALGGKIIGQSGTLGAAPPSWVRFMLFGVWAFFMDDNHFRGDSTQDSSWIYRTELTSVTIPNGVFRIEEQAFARNAITTVVLPDTVIYIGDEAFRGNRISAVTIPRNVFNIGERAFFHNGITAITIPGNVFNIGEGAFANNPLTSITFEHDAGFIHQNVFQGSMGRVTRISIGANFNLLYDGDSPDVVWNSFREAYAENGHRAGIYTLNNEGAWDWQPR